MQMLGNFGAKRIFIILYFLTPYLAKIRFFATKRADISSTPQTNSRLFKKIGILLVTMCFSMNGYLCQTKHSAHLIYLSFSKFSYRQNMFWSRNLSRNMP